MKRRQLLKHLAAHGVVLAREGANHSIYRDPRTGATVPVPRHAEISDALVRRICKEIGIPPPG
ncbi:YcfA-like protein [Rubrobacter xylanophilus DSM 9941]|uniref:YcfA-like protein n=1 Tax=Rubrobacter xylanophilus (strain DSM 9941 / JCM 11954 / NBRC 16129 / PRD-1) TaxID=266117 RepID=Q1AYG9_RUBXD|nr:type II toxin-antitoxin system HicA family toxin [Rubrobacter xylanophilus]ABG03559.1 YcfA-like protein [Rubrobacter xylanophilus DSM 9941]